MKNKINNVTTLLLTSFIIFTCEGCTTTANSKKQVEKSVETVPDANYFDPLVNETIQKESHPHPHPHPHKTKKTSNMPSPSNLPPIIDGPRLDEIDSTPPPLPARIPSPTKNKKLK